MSKPVAYVINLDRRPDRWQRMQRVWSPFFELVRFPAVDMPGKGAEGCKKSHLKLAEFVLIEKAMANNSVIVLEDDALPTPWFAKMGVEAIEQAFRNPGHWDYINMGPCIDPEFTGQANVELRTTPLPLFLRTSFSYRTHFVLYNRESLKLLRASMDTTEEVDVFMGRRAQRQLVPVHVLAVQDNSPSDIHTPRRETSVGYETSEKMLQDAIPRACVAIYLEAAPDAGEIDGMSKCSLPVISFGHGMTEGIGKFFPMRASPVPAEEPKEPARTNAIFITACVLAQREGFTHVMFMEQGDCHLGAWSKYLEAGNPRAFGGALGKTPLIVPLAVAEEMFEFSKGGTVAKAQSMKIYHHEIAWRLFRDFAKDIRKQIIPFKST